MSLSKLRANRYRVAESVFIAGMFVAIGPNMRYVKDLVMSRKHWKQEHIEKMIDTINMVMMENGSFVHMITWK